jgi:hypothetical protein
LRAEPVVDAGAVRAARADAVPALTVQDEMHLLKEELGTLSGHYEGLIAGPSGLPTKVLAAPGDPPPNAVSSSPTSVYAPAR